MDTQKGEQTLNRNVRRFFKFLIGFFILLVIFKAIFKPSDLSIHGIVQSFAIAFGTAFGIAGVEYLVEKKTMKK
jgi:hypothetical protein